MNVLLISIFFVSSTIQAQSYTTTSPDGNHVIIFKLSGGQLYYNVSYKETVILSDSRLSMTLNVEDLGENFQIVNTSTNTVNRSWKPVVGTKSSYPDAYNELVVHLRETTGSKRLLELNFSLL